MTYCRRDQEDRCSVHGGHYDIMSASCQTTLVLLEVREERAQQFAQYGTNEDLEDGTGPLKSWLAPVSNLANYELERDLRKDYDQQDQLTWMHLVREELAEALMEDDPRRLREELLQVAALCVSWVEKLDARVPSQIVPSAGLTSAS